MPDTASQTIIEPAALRLTDAVWQVMQKRRDLGGYIWPAFRELVEKNSGFDPHAEQAHLMAQLEAAGTNPTTEADLLARNSLFAATLHTWYKVPLELRAAVFQAVKEHAIVRGEDPFQAHVEVDTVLDGARSAGQAISEAYAANSARAEQERRKRDDDELQRLRKRLKVV